MSCRRPFGGCVLLRSAMLGDHASISATRGPCLCACRPRRSVDDCGQGGANGRRQSEGDPQSARVAASAQRLRYDCGEAGRQRVFGHLPTSTSSGTSRGGTADAASRDPPRAPPHFDIGRVGQRRVGGPAGAGADDPLTDGSGIGVLRGGPAPPDHQQPGMPGGDAAPPRRR